MEESAPMWTPSAERIAASRLDGFRRYVNTTHGLDLAAGDYESLHRWSVEESAAFWRAVWDFCGVVGDPGAMLVEPGDELKATRFLPNATLNFAENLLRRDGDGLAMLFRGEDRVSVELTWEMLTILVSRLQQAMRAAGIGPGDRVAMWLPNIPEGYAVMLAATSLGAVFSSCSPDFGVDGVVDRFGQIEPKLLFATDRYLYAGVERDCLDRLAEISERLPSVELTVMVPYLDETGAMGGVDNAVELAELIDGFEPAEPTFERLPFDHPLYILFSSGTTGAPKCIVHRAGGVLLKHLCEQQLHCDIKPDDRVFYFTTAGWMMWNWLASVLASEATLVLYDGSPFHPDGAVLFDLADEVGVTLFGTSAKFIEAIGKAGLAPAETHGLDTVRTITSTGSALVPEGFDTVYERIFPEAQLASISGGTDLCGCLVGGDPTGPVWRGEIQRPQLGMDMDVVDARGESVAAGEQGELVCRNAFPSMPLAFWNDPHGDRYSAAYFERFPGMWHQGDFAERTEHGGYIIHGRSDATLNPGGVRIGTAEIYRRVDALDEIVESLVIGQEWEGDTRVVLFVVLRNGFELDDDLAATIRSSIRAGASPRHVPARIVAVADLPRTRSGKLSELAVRDVVHGRAVANTEALANADALELFRDLPDLQT